MSDQTSDPKTDYKSTVFLPQTDFPMKAELPKREPALLAQWAREGLYEKLREQRKGREKFILHDGPPYANGNIHIGHALNKILKDVIIRSQSMLGKDAPYVPGWDCHGLPIEWKIEEEYRAKGKNKDQVPLAEFRQECRDFAAKWIDVQSAEFQRLGIMGRWDKPYTTMTFKAEAQIVRELNSFAMNGLLYRGAKPVMWSPVEKTALAEAEIEYEDITSTQIDVAFPITHCPQHPELVGAHVVIWTTTPWTIPVNRALAYGPDVEYVAIEFGNTQLVIAEKLLFDFWFRLALREDQQNIPRQEKPGDNVVWRGKGSDLEGTLCAHPWKPLFDDASPLPSWEREGPDAQRREGEGDKGEGENSASPVSSPSPDRFAATLSHEGRGIAAFFTAPRPLLPGEFVTTDTGTGFVHLAPDHGEDDFYTCRAHGIDPVFVVQPDGSYLADWPVVGGNNVLNNKLPGIVIESLGDSCLSHGPFNHSYPHSWRSKKKVIYRCTPQWFVRMDQAMQGGHSLTLREAASQAIFETRFVPDQGRNRIGAMVEGRPDWVLSRQRAWGVPITVFAKADGTVLRDAAVNARIEAAVEAGGADAWFADARQFLAGVPDADQYEPVFDILDVWFDSGSTHAFVLESGEWPELVRTDGKRPADLYLEGSDQHRGWFQSSLLERCGTRGTAPYSAVLTHGFVLDGEGRKMSKSLGNVVAPQKVIDQYGADILRLWVVSTDYNDDVRIGEEILKGQAESYRKIRNTLRYLLGNLAGFSDAERLPFAEMPGLERYVLHRVAELDTLIRQAINDFDFHRIYSAVHNFCTVELSAVYFDIRKDSLYCDAATHTRRRACRTVLDILFNSLVAWLAPIIPFTAEEAWQTRAQNPADSIHLRELPAIPAKWRDATLAETWGHILAVRRVVTGALEIDRREKRIGASLQGHPTVYIDRPILREAFTGIDPAEIFITSSALLVDGVAPDTAFRLPDVEAVGVVTGLAEGEKCQRCWQVLPEVGRDQTGLCRRCADAVS